MFRPLLYTKDPKSIKTKLLLSPTFNSYL